MRMSTLHTLLTHKYKRKDSFAVSNEYSELIMYGKIINGDICLAPDNIVCKLTVNGTTKPFRVFCPTDEQYKAAGYLPIEFDGMETSNIIFDCSFVERDGKIIGVKNENMYLSAHDEFEAVELS